MNDNRNFEYEKYVNSYGVKEIEREARQARRLKESQGDMPNAGGVKRLILRIAPVAVAISLLLSLLS